MRRTSGAITPVVIAALLAAHTATAAVGCTLNDPDRDIARIFPDAVGYETEFLSIAEHGADSLAAGIEARLGDALDPVYETIDVPYAYYTILGPGGAILGRVHGVNQRGTYGGMQIILATDPRGVIIDFYYQKLSSPEAARFRDQAFTGSFRGLSIRDFERESPDRRREVVDVRQRPLDDIADPSEKSAEDFKATLRGITKSLILLDEFHGIGGPPPGKEETNEENHR